MKIKYISLLSACLLLTSVLPFNCFAAENTLDISNQKSDSKNEVYYSDYSANQKVGASVKPVEIAGDKLVSVSADKTEYAFSAKTEEGSYNIEISYSLPETEGNNLSVNVTVDGKNPFEESKSIKLPRFWVDSPDGVRTDNNNNEYAPEQVEIEKSQTVRLEDSTGAETEPFLFSFSKGIHNINLKFNTDEKIVISKISLVPQIETVTYDKQKEIYVQNGYQSANAELITVEAENSEYKSNRSLAPKSDGSSPAVSPANAVTQKINYIGGSTWKNPGDTISWMIDVKETGLYNIGFMYKQEENLNSNSYRSLKIDGETPFEECKNLKFYYSSDWKFYSPSDSEGNSYEFYLEEGTHILSLTSTLGETAEYYKKLKDITSDIGDMYIDITMITGESPDTNRDYNLFEQIPEFNERLSRMKSDLDGVAAGLKEIAGDNTTSLVTSLINMARVLQSMVDHPYESHKYVGDYYSNYTTVSSWLYDMKAMSLSIDRIELCPADKEFDTAKVSFFKRLSFGITRFVSSFSSDYNSYSSDEKSDSSVKIWVNWGRDQAMVLNNLITESFTPETGISVNLEITNASLINGMLSGNAPDLSLHLARTEPVNLAMRGALYPLSDFEDYKSVTESFGASASIPYEYGGKIYALPDTQAFFVMFYRSDILKELEIEVPETWEEFIAATAVLQRNNMTSWIPYTQITASTTVNIGVGGLNLFPSILQQFGGSFYNSENNGCAWSSDPVMLNAFSFWTDMYTKYKMPTTLSFYNRFRSGTSPLGIEVYTVYTNLAQAAPEIEGRWGIALVPGVKQKDGTVKHTVSGSGTGCAILNASKHKQEAWEFLKWWTSAKTQLLYNNNVESILGAVSRVTTANLEAFSTMDWKSEDLEILLKQREWIEEIPEIPGSYYVSRSVDQAFWGVINKSERPKDMLEEWGQIANQEIKRKIAEYSN